MKFKQLLTVSSLIGITLMTSSCKKEAPTPPMGKLNADVMLRLADYNREYTKDSTGFYSLTATSSKALLQQSGDFFENVAFEVADSTLPNSEKGEYNKLKLTSGTALAHQFASPVAGSLMTSHITCEVKFTEGSFDEFQKSGTGTLQYSEAGVNELKKIYVEQLKKEYSAYIEDLMWKEIEERTRDHFNAQEARNRYSLNMETSIIAAEVPVATVRFDNDKASVNYDETLQFIVQFFSDVKVVK